MGVPSLIISTPNKDERLIDDDSQTRYRSAVGSILYLVKLVDQIYLIYQGKFLKLWWNVNNFIIHYYYDH